MAHSRRSLLLVPVLAALTLPIGLWTAQAHGPGNPYGNNVEFGLLGVEDPDTARKVEPRHIRIKLGETVTFHVNGSHQVVVLKPGVPLEALGSEGVNLDGTGPQTPLPPQVFGNNVTLAGLAPRFGPGRWDMNPASCGGSTLEPREATNVDRPEVFDKQDCPTPPPTPPNLTTDWTTAAFTVPGRYAFICNFPAHFWDEGIPVTGPANPDRPITVNTFGMHGFIYVQ